MSWAFLRITSGGPLVAFSLVRPRKDHRGVDLISDAQSTTASFPAVHMTP